jgi:hypothetical protein
MDLIVYTLNILRIWLIIGQNMQSLIFFFKTNTSYIFEVREYLQNNIARAGYIDHFVKGVF